MCFCVLSKYHVLKKKGNVFAVRFLLKKKKKLSTFAATQSSHDYSVSSHLEMASYLCVVLILIQPSTAKAHRWFNYCTLLVETECVFIHRYLNN